MNLVLILKTTIEIFFFCTEVFRLIYPFNPVRKVLVDIRTTTFQGDING